MIDFLALIIGFFLISCLILIILFCVKFLYSLATLGQSNNTSNEETDKQLLDDSKEDSSGDGLLLFDDPLFADELE